MFWQMKLVNNFINLITWLFKKFILICKLYIVLLPNLFHPYVTIIAGGKVVISGKMVHIWEYF